MPVFSDILRAYINISGITIYQLSKDSGVNRTSIQKALTENRILQKESLKKIIPFLNLNQAEQDCLWEAYEALLYGNDLFNQRKSVKSFIESMEISYDSIRKSIKSSQKAPAKSFLPENKKLYTGTYEIKVLLETLIQEEFFQNEHPTILLSVAFQEHFYDQFFDLIYQFDYKKLLLRQIIHFVNNPLLFHDSNYNIRILSSILPHVLIKGDGYHIYQNYTKGDTENINYFSGFILFSGCLLSLSSDCQTACIERSEDIIDYVRKKFEFESEHSQSLFRQYMNPLSVGIHIQNCDCTIDSLCWIEYQPCFIPMCSSDMIESIIPASAPERSSLVAIVMERLGIFSKIPNIISLFSKDSLAEFTKNGTLMNVPSEYARPLTLEERLYLLEQLYCICQDNPCSIRAINPLRFPISKHVSITVHGKRQIDLSVFDPETNKYYYIVITENTLVQAFVDFFSYLVDSIWLYSKEQTLDILQQYIENLKKTLTKKEPGSC